LIGRGLLRQLLTEHRHRPLARRPRVGGLAGRAHHGDPCQRAQDADDRSEGQRLPASPLGS